ncbi:bifunctional UDP-N-acetylglucosamine diphosphorylase/glucosamine-1-phosphate N-acetyltransferase GlmU [Microlunatus panaciterrae]|uniref:Bifunctional protein GlmU n=1 Tax=Microlunatus panaciterrae TaxID=400768 RepID=A0ABS2RGD6_9ACTN|nr:bifunctional UDP-N-acetylglucosamine diphosphorylase/glucosamine-1-phosphate N-acetyltransferase GlmU [Microlunatus panaciterrae]MBM7798074.1 bifunctional UDP-N-acetylglucosamine pyrophosphorylase/glucosamine-1-phosphate N-acetyltransferase [Microlunatus panaciterrae]
MSARPDPADRRAAPIAAVVVLAAGGGTRMKSARSKLLHEVAGHSMLSYAVDAATAVEPQHLVVVVGHQREQVQAHLTDIAPHVRTAVQAEQKGTGHAVQCGLAELGELAGEIVVTYGDVPMLTGETLKELVTTHREAGDAITVLTAHVANPTGYGRIIRDDDDTVARIVEERDAAEHERRVTEINSGIYVFDAEVLREGLGQLTANNDQGELYLTDVISVARRSGGRVGAFVIEDLWQTEGINDRLQLSRMNAEMNRRILERWMRAGVTIADPATTWIHADVDLAEDVTLLPGTTLQGATSVATGAVIGPETTLTDVEVGENATVTRTQGSLASIGAGAVVGPFAYLRPGTILEAKGKIGTFVETKNARIGPGAKVPHLTYAGDVVIGEGANIGAGTIFANYDGVTKAVTTVGRYSFVGSNSVLTAPVTIGDGAYVAAGSAVTGDVDPGQLAVARGRQRNINGWVARKRAGSKTAEAAAEASASSDAQTQQGDQS